MTKNKIGSNNISNKINIQTLWTILIVLFHFFTGAETSLAGRKTEIGSGKYRKTELQTRTQINRDSLTETERHLIKTREKETKHRQERQRDNIDKRETGKINLGEQNRRFDMRTSRQ